MIKYPRLSKEPTISFTHPEGIAVYVYRHQGGTRELLQIHRSAETGEYQHSWQTVYGGTEENETAIAAALRELFEETHLTPLRMFQVEYIETFYMAMHDRILMMPVFAVEVSPDSLVTLNEEHDAHRWIPAADYESHFMFRTQREALKILLEALDHPTTAQPLLEINLPRLPSKN